jgi:N-methylhydantoinase B
VASAAFGAIDLEILRRKLVAVAGEMGLQLRKTAQSPEINTEQDYATAIVDRSGAVVATDNPLQLGALSGTARTVVDHFRFNMRPGDIVVTNAPEFGGTRAVDLAVLTPLFVGNSALLYFIVRARVPDLGGMYVGGFNPAATEFFAEGVPVTPLKLYREGREARDVMTTLLLNSRFPDSFRLVLDSLIAAMRTGERRIRDLASDYGPEALRAALDHAQAYVEKRVRAEVARWTAGTYSSEAALSPAGPSGDALHVRVDVVVTNEGVRIDFSRSDPQAACFVNSTLSNTVGFAATAALAELGEDVPANDGLFRVVAVACDPGRITSAAPISAFGWSAAHCGAEVLEATSRALRAARQATHGDLATSKMLLSCRPGVSRRGRIALDAWSVGSASASAQLDGWNRPALMSRSVLPSVEEWERTAPVSVLRFEFVKDSAGPGEWRGAPSTEAALRMPVGHLVTYWWQGPVSYGSGVNGGRTGAGTVLSWDGCGSTHASGPFSQVDQPMPSNLLLIAGGGGAGYGLPTARDPEAVLADVLDGIVSTEAAAETYGVVLTANGRAVDAKATARLRAASGG